MSHKFDTGGTTERAHPAMSTTSDTPRVDEMAFTAEAAVGRIEVVHVSVARQLEREITAQEDRRIELAHQLATTLNDLGAAIAAKERAEERVKALAAMCALLMIESGDREAEQYREVAHQIGERMSDAGTTLKEILDTALAGQEGMV